MGATDGALELRLHVPLRLRRAENNRDAHWGQRAARVKAERRTVFLATLGAVRAMLSSLAGESLPPCTVTLTRVAPGRGLDGHDTLGGSFKAVVDELAAILGVDDRDPRVTWKYQQERGPWGVWVHISAVLPGPQISAPKRAQRQPPKPRAAVEMVGESTAVLIRGKPALLIKPAKPAAGMVALARPAYVAPRRSP